METAFAAVLLAFSVLFSVVNTPAATHQQVTDAIAGAHSAIQSAEQVAGGSSSTLLASLQELDAAINALAGGGSAITSSTLATPYTGAGTGVGTQQPFCHTFQTNLSVGVTGNEVLFLQQALLGDGETINNTGTFDDQTAAAVTAFQEKYASAILTPNGLQHGTGYVGISTRSKLNALFACAENGNGNGVAAVVPTSTLMNGAVAVGTNAAGDNTSGYPSTPPTPVTSGVDTSRIPTGADCFSSPTRLVWDTDLMDLYIMDINNHALMQRTQSLAALQRSTYSCRLPTGDNLPYVSNPNWIAGGNDLPASVISSSACAHSASLNVTACAVLNALNPQYAQYASTAGLPVSNVYINAPLRSCTSQQFKTAYGQITLPVCSDVPLSMELAGSAIYMPGTNQLMNTLPDGTVLTYHNPDGSVVTPGQATPPTYFENADNTISVRNPDGTATVVASSRAALASCLALEKTFASAPSGTQPSAALLACEPTAGGNSSIASTGAGVGNNGGVDASSFASSGAINGGCPAGSFKRPVVGDCLKGTAPAVLEDGGIDYILSADGTHYINDPAYSSPTNCQQYLALAAQLTPSAIVTLSTSDLVHYPYSSPNYIPGIGHQLTVHTSLPNPGYYPLAAYDKECEQITQAAGSPGGIGSRYGGNVNLIDISSDNMSSIPAINVDLSGMFGATQDVVLPNIVASWGFDTNSKYPINIDWTSMPAAKTATFYFMRPFSPSTGCNTACIPVIIQTIGSGSGSGGHLQIPVPNPGGPDDPGGNNAAATYFVRAVTDNGLIFDSALFNLINPSQTCAAHTTSVANSSFGGGQVCVPDSPGDGGLTGAFGFSAGMGGAGIDFSKTSVSGSNVNLAQLGTICPTCNGSESASYAAAQNSYLVDGVGFIPGVSTINLGFSLPVSTAKYVHAYLVKLDDLCTPYSFPSATEQCPTNVNWTVQAVNGNPGHPDAIPIPNTTDGGLNIRLDQNCNGYAGMYCTGAVTISPTLTAGLSTGDYYFIDIMSDDNGNSVSGAYPAGHLNAEFPFFLSATYGNTMNFTADIRGHIRGSLYASADGKVPPPATVNAGDYGTASNPAASSTPPANGTGIAVKFTTSNPNTSQMTQTDTYGIQVTGLSPNQGHTLTVTNNGTASDYSIVSDGSGNALLFGSSALSLASAQGSYHESFAVDHAAVTNVTENGSQLCSGTAPRVCDAVTFTVGAAASVTPGAAVTCSTSQPTSGCSNSYYHCHANNVTWSSCSPASVASQDPYTYDASCVTAANNQGQTGECLSSGTRR